MQNDRVDRLMVGDRVRDKRFNRPLYGEVISIDESCNRLVIRTDRGNFSVDADMMERSNGS